MTGTVAIDQSGDRMLSLQLRNIQNGIQKKYVRIADYFGMTGKLEFRKGSTIVWPGPTSDVPLGRPECGFDNELCNDESGYWPSYLKADLRSLTLYSPCRRHATSIAVQHRHMCSHLDHRHLVLLPEVRRESVTVHS